MPRAPQSFPTTVQLKLTREELDLLILTLANHQGAVAKRNAGELPAVIPATAQKLARALDSLENSPF